MLQAIVQVSTRGLWPSNDAISPFQDEVANEDNQIEDVESMDMCSYNKRLNQGMTCFKPRCMNSAKDLQLAQHRIW